MANVISLQPTAPATAALGAAPANGDANRKVAARWTTRLASRFCAVSSFFLQNYHRLKPHDGARGLNSTEAMVIIQLMDFKWDERAPFPSLGTIATRMDLNVRSVRAAVKRLEELGYLKRDFNMNGGTNRYYLDGLFAALEKLMDDDLAAQDKTVSPAAEA